MTGPGGSPGRWWPCRPGPLGKPPPCAVVGASSPLPGPIAPGGGWPGSPGTTRTCPGTPPSCGWGSCTVRTTGAWPWPSLVWLPAAGRRARERGGVGGTAPLARRRPAGVRLGRRGVVAAVVLGARGAGRRACAGTKAEFHGPDWVLGQATMAELGDGQPRLPPPPGGHRRAGDGADGRWGRSRLRPALCLGGRGLRPRRGAGLARLHARSGRRGRGGRRGPTGRSGMRHRSATPAPARSSRTTSQWPSPSRSPTERGELPGLYYRPTLAGVAGSRRRPTAARGLLPLGPNRLRRGRLRPGGPVLHQPRLRRGRRRLRREHRLRPRLPPPPVGRLGAGRRRRLRRRRPGPGRRGGWPTASGWPCGGAAPGGSPPCARWPAQGPSPPPCRGTG